MPTRGSESPATARKNSGCGTKSASRSRRISLRALEAVLERSGLVTDAAVSSEIYGVEPAIPKLGDLASCERFRLVRRIVENLNLELVRRIIEARDRVEESLHDRRLVEERQLNGHGRKIGFLDGRSVERGSQVLPVPDAHPDEVRAVHTIRTEKKENGEVEDDENRHGRPFSNIRSDAECHSNVIFCTGLSWAIFAFISST